MPDAKALQTSVVERVRGASAYTSFRIHRAREQVRMARTAGGASPDAPQKTSRCRGVTGCRSRLRTARCFCGASGRCPPRPVHPHSDLLAARWIPKPSVCREPLAPALHALFAMPCIGIGARRLRTRLDEMFSRRLDRRSAPCARSDTLIFRMPAVRAWRSSGRALVSACPHLASR